MKHIPKKLSGFALKYIAMVSMLCDHANMLVIRRGFFAPFRGEDGSTLIPQNAPAWLGAVQGVYRVFDVLGHLAFPLYVFLLAEGFTHTRDRKRYFLTLLAFALVSEPVFNLAHYEQWTGPALQNVLFTLSLSCLELFVLARIESDAAERGKRIALYVLTCLVFGAAAFAVRSEYVFLGTLSAALFYLLRSAGVWRLAGLLPLLIASPWVLLCAPLLLLYSGERGRARRKIFLLLFLSRALSPFAAAREMDRYSPCIRKARSLLLCAFSSYSDTGSYSRPAAKRAIISLVRATPLSR